MIKKLSIYTLLICSILFICSLSFAEENKESVYPDAFFPEKIFKFNNVVESTQVKHHFKLLNKGNAPLFVQKVKAG